MPNKTTHMGITPSANVSISKKNLHTILQILNLTMFKKMPLKQLLNASARPVPAIFENKQLNLFSF